MRIFLIFCITRWIAAGSEDGAAHVYALRTGGLLCRIPGAKDVVSDVDFHPSKPQLVSVSLDGQARFYTC